jgi:N-hydroxyarylamine O-acetyltransferase
MKSSRYLEEIGVPSRDIKTLSPEEQLRYLSTIYLTFLKSFPYQNFELRASSYQHPVVRSPLTFFSQLKEGTNGGHCFQSTAKLFDLLSELGFECTRYSARVNNRLPINDPALFAFPATHVFLLVKIKDQQYLLDPGFSPACPTAPLPIEPNGSLAEVSQGHRRYRFRKHDENTFVLERMIDTEWGTLYQTDLKMIDEKQMKRALSRLEKSLRQLPIRDKKLIAGIVTDTGSKKLYWESGDSEFVYSVEDGSNFTKQAIKDAFEVSCLLNKEFNITTLSTHDITLLMQEQKLPKPKTSWTVDLPIDNAEKKRLGSNF